MSFAWPVALLLLLLIPAGALAYRAIGRRRLRTPPGEVYSKVEAPRGEWGVYLISKGGDKPYRAKMRSSSFCNLSALREMTVGHFLADAVLILGSVDIVLGCVDR